MEGILHAPGFSQFSLMLLKRHKKSRPANWQVCFIFSASIFLTD
jgi:hypothetical protein